MNLIDIRLISKFFFIKKTHSDKVGILMFSHVKADKIVFSAVISSRLSIYSIAHDITTNKFT